MIPNILITKLVAPQIQAKLVPRPRLLSMLQVGQDAGRKITLVSAPAGYGKTTLVVEWVKSQPTKTAWISLDEIDNDPVRFATTIIAAIQYSGVCIGDAILPLLQSHQPLPQTTILTSLLNEIAGLPAPLVLALDDYHCIQSPAVHQQMAFILEHLPVNLHIIMLTREDPPLPIARLRAGGQLTELREMDLRFTFSECALFLQDAMGLKISSQEIAALERRTEGWIAGLQMAALSLHGRTDTDAFIRDFTGSNRYILDYLTEEVLKRQPDIIQSFLLRTSILDRFSATLCAEITGVQHCQAILKKLEQENLFVIALDQSRQWYRYHRMFAELLRHRLRAEHPSLEDELHVQASHWFEEQELQGEAIQHALAAKDWSHAAALIGRAADGVLKKGEAFTLINWFQKLPPEILQTQINLGMAYVWALLLTGQYPPAEKLLDEYEKAAGAQPAIMGLVTTAQAFAARALGNNTQVIEKSQKALALLPESEINSRATLALNLGLVFWHEGRLKEAIPALTQAQELALMAGNNYGDLTAQIFIARTQASRGELRQAAENYQTIIRQNKHNPALTLAYYDMSALYHEWNERSQAWETVKTGLDLSTQAGNREFQNSGHLLNSIYHLADHNFQAAISEIEICQKLSRELNRATQARCLACRALIALGMQDIQQAGVWLEQMPEDADAHPFYRFLGLTKAKILLAQGEYGKARQELRSCLARAEQMDCGYARIPILAMLALHEEQTVAAGVLARALALSQPQGFIRSYLDLGADLVPLLKEAAQQGYAPQYVGEILAAMKLPASESSLPFGETLSERETEILRLVAAGLSNREIARQLFISTGTAKTHIHNLCGKLGVRNRTEAAMRAKDLRLV